MDSTIAVVIMCSLPFDAFVMAVLGPYLGGVVVAIGLLLVSANGW